MSGNPHAIPPFRLLTGYSKSFAEDDPESQESSDIHSTNGKRALRPGPHTSPFAACGPSHGEDGEGMVEVVAALPRHLSISEPSVGQALEPPQAGLGFLVSLVVKEVQRLLRRRKSSWACIRGTLLVLHRIVCTHCLCYLA